MSEGGRLAALRRVAADLREDLRIVARRVGHPERLAHPSVLFDMSSAALILLRTSIGLRRTTGGSYGTRSVLKWVFHIDVWTDDIGPGLTLPHPFNIVIGSGVAIGHGCTIMHNTTIQHSTRTRIGDGAVLGAGAVILADRSVGRGSFCGANSVVTRDVPDDTVVVGVPAKPTRAVKSRSDEVS
jgi:serine acetyltransferase